MGHPTIGPHFVDFTIMYLWRGLYGSPHHWSALCGLHYHVSLEGSIWVTPPLVRTLWTSLSCISGGVYMGHPTIGPHFVDFTIMYFWRGLYGSPHHWSALCGLHYHVFLEGSIWVTPPLVRT